MLVWPSVPPEFCKDGAKLILGLQTVNTCLKKTNKPSNTVSAGDLCGWHSLRLCSSHGLELITVLKKEEKKEQAFLSALLHVDGSCVPACPPFLYTPTLCSNKGTVNHITWAREQTARCSAGPSLSFKLSLRCVIMLIIVRKGSNWLAASCSAFWALWREVRPALAVGPLWLEHDFAVWSFQTGPVSEWPGRMARTVIFHVYFLECDASTEA